MLTLPFLEGVRTRLATPVDIAALVGLRVLFGLMMVVSLCRFAANGWVEKVYKEPSYFFSYPGFTWIKALPLEAMYILYAVLALSAASIALGFFYRASIIVFFSGFTYLQLIDVTLYLNHYYLVCLVSFIFIFLPLNAYLSLDVYFGRENIRATFPVWATYILRFQVAVVYLYAGLAKAHPDWLWYGQPLSLWLHARTETWLIGPLFDYPYSALIMSWGGFLYDLTIWIFLLIPQTRIPAYGVATLFHLITSMLFDIGMFPIIMLVLTTVFFSPSWPRQSIKLIGCHIFKIAPSLSNGKTRTENRSSRSAQPLSKQFVAVLSLYALIQVGIPMRHWFLPGDVLWNERGMRFAWKVMVREKNGSITYRVRAPTAARDLEISPLRYLTWRQFSDMSGQPDLILQLGRHIGEDYDRILGGPVEVRVNAWVSLNGRPPALMVNPDTNLRSIETSSQYQRWLRPMPSTPPLIMHPTYEL